MGQLRIVTDSTADIPSAVRKCYGIEMVPLKVHFQEETYQDAVTINNEQFYAKLVQAKQLPTTSQPSPLEFLDVYQRLYEEGSQEVISIHISSALSGTYQSALLAKNMFTEQMDIMIIDSKSGSLGFGSMVIEAARMAAAGCSKEEIVALIQWYSLHRKLYFLVDTLEFLHKGGRIGKAAALFGTLLTIKPILSINEAGEVYAVDKVRGRKRALMHILERLEQEFAVRPVHLVIGYANNKEVTSDLTAEIKRKFDVRSLQYVAIGGVVGAHIGMDAVAVSIWPADDVRFFSNYVQDVNDLHT